MAAQLACDRGKYQDQTGSDLCKTCLGGHYQSLIGQTHCLESQPGFFVSEPSAASPTMCEPGKYMANLGLLWCEDCNDGMYQDQFGQSECYGTPVGYHAPSTQTVNPVACQPGSFQDEVGQPLCKRCDDEDFHNLIWPTSSILDSIHPNYDANIAFDPSAFYSTLGMGYCDICKQDYFRFGLVDPENNHYGSTTNAHGEACVQCTDDEIECPGAGLTVEQLNIQEGYWRTSETSKVFEDCQQKANSNGCAGGTHTGPGNCKEGHAGPLCALCLPDWYGSGRIRTCKPCKKVTEDTFFHVFGGIIVGVIVLSAIFRKKIARWIESFYERALENPRIKKLVRWYETNALMPKIKVLLAFWQILATMPGVLDMSYPDPYDSVMAALSFTSLDFMSFVPMPCFAELSAMARVMFISLFPIGVCFLCVLPFSIMSAIARTEAMKEKAEHYKQLSYGACVFIMYAVFPSVSIVMLEHVAAPYELDPDGGGEYAGQKYVQPSFKVSTEDDIYSPIVIFCYVMILVYPIGCPVGILGVLGWYRRRIRGFQNVQLGMIEALNDLDALEAYEGEKAAQRRERALKRRNSEDEEAMNNRRSSFGKAFSFFHKNDGEDIDVPDAAAPKGRRAPRGAQDGATEEFGSDAFLWFEMRQKLLRRDRYHALMIRKLDLKMSDPSKARVEREKKAILRGEDTNQRMSLGELKAAISDQVEYMNCFCDLLETGEGPDYDEDVKKVEDDLLRTHHLFHTEMGILNKATHDGNNKMQRQNTIKDYNKKVKILKTERDDIKELKDLIADSTRKVAKHEKKGATNTSYHQALAQQEQELLKIQLQRQEIDAKQEEEDLEKPEELIAKDIALQYVVFEDIAEFTDAYEGFDMSMYSMLFVDYRVWWWEGFESFRRICLTGFLMLFRQGSPSQVLVAIFVELISLKTFLRTNPHLQESDNAIAEAAHWATLGVYLFSMLLHVDTSNDGDAAAAYYSWTMTFMAFGIPLLIIFMIVYLFYNAKNQSYEKHTYESTDSAKNLRENAAKKADKKKNKKNKNRAGEDDDDNMLELVSP